MAHRPFMQDKPSYRPAKVAERIKEELAGLIPGELKDPRLDGIAFFTITNVGVTPDLRNANIQFTLADSEKTRAREVEAGLNKAAGFLRRELMQRLQIKITPHLAFKYDKGYDNTNRIDHLLRQASEASREEE
ncbi:MAG: 30S ribosome-binding factor RbfA [Bdellovibrionota bacterium]